MSSDPAVLRKRRLRRQPRTSFANLGFQFVKIGASRFDFSDPYHMALTARWPTFVLGVLVLYAAVTGLFAGLYMLGPGCVANATGPADDFFFSIETLATVGYGVMAPASLYGHLVASTEIVCGMAFTAIMTGLVFVRFSKPRAKFVFSEVGIIARHNGRPTLMVRVGNGRQTALTQTTVEINALINERTPEGGYYRRVSELRLARGSFPVFPLITTVMHVIDNESPLATLDLTRVEESDIRLIVTVAARDPQLAAVVHDLRSYAANEVRVGERFVNAVEVHEDGLVVADLTLISKTEPDPHWA